MSPQQNPPPISRGKRALVQSTLAGVYILFAFAAISFFQGRFAMASLAASAFITFSFAGSESATPRQLLGGYACGIVLGGLVCFLWHTLPPGWNGNQSVVIFCCALAVLLCCLFMNLFDVQHPPAAALALAMVLEENPVPIGFTTLACVLALAGLRLLALRYLGPYLESL